MVLIVAVVIIVERIMDHKNSGGIGMVVGENNGKM